MHRITFIDPKPPRPSLEGGEDSLRFSVMQHHKGSPCTIMNKAWFPLSRRVLKSVAEYRRVSQSIAECHRVT